MIPYCRCHRCCSWTIKFILTGFITQLLYYRKNTHITTVKIIAAIIHCVSSPLPFLIGCVIVARVGRTEKYLNKCK